MRAPSLRWRLVLLAAITIAVTLGVAGLALVLIFERHIEQRVEQELDIKLTELLGAFALDGNQPKLSHMLSDPRYEQPLSGAYWQVSTDLAPVLQSRSLWDQSLALRSPGGSRAYEIAWPNDVTLYVIDRQVTLENAGDLRRFRLAVGLDHADVDALRASFIGDVVKALGVIGTVLLIGAWLQIHLGLRPLAQLRQRLAVMHAGRSDRLDGVFPSEVAPLAEDLNALLDRQRDMLRKARERAGSLAHGLKTPLTILQGEARRLDERGIGDAANTLRDQVRRMRAHVERELARARSHGSAAPGGLHTKAHKSVGKLMDLVRRMPRSDELVFINNLPIGLLMQIDPDDFGEVIGNLLDNARKYARGNVVVSAQLRDGFATLGVDDDGPGIPAHLRQRLVQRGEQANEDAEGSGLGLAIARDLLGDYGVDLTIADSPSGGCRIQFSLPGGIEAGWPQVSVPLRVASAVTMAAKIRTKM